jgi:hypothetical protein
MALGQFDFASVWESAKTTAETAVKSTPTEEKEEEVVVQEAPETPWHDVVTDLIGATSSGFESVMKGIAAYTAAEQAPSVYTQAALVPTGPTEQELELQRLKTEEQIARLRAEQAASTVQAVSTVQAKEGDKEDKTPWGMYLGIGGAAVAVALAAVVFMRR